MSTTYCSILSSQGNLTPHDKRGAERAAQLNACSAPTNLAKSAVHISTEQLHAFAKTLAE